LIAGARGVPLAAQFQPVFDARIVTRWKEEAQSKFGELFVENMLP